VLIVQSIRASLAFEFVSFNYTDKLIELAGSNYCEDFF